MFSLLTFLIRIICTLFKSKKELIIQLHVHKKELEILKRLNQKKRIKTKHYDRVIFSILNRIASIKEIIWLLYIISFTVTAIAATPVNLVTCKFP